MGFGEDVGTQVRGERFGRDEFHAVAQRPLQELAQGQQMVEGLLAGGKLDQHIHVAVAARFIPLHGTEERQALDAQAENLRADGRHASLHVGAGQDRGRHGPNLGAHAASGTTSAAHVAPA